MDKFKLFSIGAILVVMLLGLAIPAEAQSWRIASGDYRLNKDQTVKGDLIFSGERVVIDGTIEGDLLLFAGEATINGRVSGSVLGLVSGSFKHNGFIGGSIRGLVNEIRIDKTGVIEKSITVMAIKLFTQPGSEIKTGILGRFIDIELAGRVAGPVQIESANSTKLSGEIAGDLQIKGVPAQWKSPVIISGKVTDFTGSGIDPRKTKGVKIDGGYEEGKLLVDDQIAVLKGSLLFTFIWFVGSILASLIFYRLFPRTAWMVTEPSPVNLRRSLLVGLVGTISIPILIIMLAVTIVGIPLAILLGIFYLIILFFTAIPLNIWFGRLIFKSRINPVLMTVFGGLMLSLVNMLPIFIAIPAQIFLFILGAGMIIGNIHIQANQQPPIDLRTQ